MEQMKCKWISDEFSEICTNPDCDYLADFCPCTEHPQICNHAELVEGDEQGKLKKGTGGIIWATRQK